MITPERQAVLQSASTGVATPARAVRVLVVEDEPAVRRMLVRLLEHWGCQVTAVESGAEALHCFRPDERAGVIDAAQTKASVPYDMVCTDLGLPDRSGWKVLDAVCAVAPAIVTVLITGWGQHINRDQARARGVTYLLTKPFDIAELRRAVLTARTQPTDTT